MSERCRGTDGLLCLLTDKLDRRFLERNTHLKGIATMAVGYNNIDVKAAAELGIPVSNTPRGSDRGHRRAFLGPAPGNRPPDPGSGTIPAGGKI